MADEVSPPGDTRFPAREADPRLALHRDERAHGDPSTFATCLPRAAMSGAESVAAVPPPLAAEQPPLQGEPLTDGDEPPIVIAEAYLQVQKLAPDGDIFTCQRCLLWLFAAPKTRAVAALQRLRCGPSCHPVTRHPAKFLHSGVPRPGLGGGGASALGHRGLRHVSPRRGRPRPRRCAAAAHATTEHTAARGIRCALRRRATKLTRTVRTGYCPAFSVLYVPEAQGSLPRGGQY